MSQVPLFIDTPTGKQRIYRLSRKAGKRRAASHQPELVADHAFTPVETVPATRADCPKDGGICPHVRCRFNLLVEDAEHRAGRPGLSSVPRDARGLTLSVPGTVGHERPKATLRPAWLTYRGLQAEREVKVYISRDGRVSGLHTGALEYWLDRVHLGEPVLVFNDDTAEVLTKATLTAEGLRLEREIPEAVLTSSSALVLTRVRPVSSCALDEIDRKGRPLTNEETGDCLGRHRTLIGREVKRAMGKAVRNAGAMGMTEADLLRGLRELGVGA